MRVIAGNVRPAATSTAACPARLAALATLSVALTFAPSAVAQDDAVGLAQSLGDIDLPREPRRAPFDLEYAYDGSALTVGLFQARTPSTDRAQRGWDIRLGRELELRRFHFFLLGGSDTSFRAFDSKSFSLVLARPGLAGGVYLGPVELGAGFALDLLSLDDFDTHYSAQSLSPTAHAELALRFGPVRVAAQIFAEEYWRWFGPDRRLRGVAIDLSFSREPTKR
jgi:hypothetical protein